MKPYHILYILPCQFNCYGLSFTIVKNYVLICKIKKIAIELKCFCNLVIQLIFFESKEKSGVVVLVVVYSIYVTEGSDFRWRIGNRLH